MLELEVVDHSKNLRTHLQYTVARFDGKNHTELVANISFEEISYLATLWGVFFFSFFFFFSNVPDVDTRSYFTLDRAAY